MNTSAPSPRFYFAWLLDARRDLVFYIGSALVGWLYLAVVCYAIISLDNPLEDAFATLDIGPFALARSRWIFSSLSAGPTSSTHRTSG